MRPDGAEAGGEDLDFVGRQPSPRDSDCCLMVEGMDDLATVLALTQMRSVGWSSRRHVSPWFPYIRNAGGKKQVLKQLEQLLKESGRTRVGVVLDADTSAEEALKQLRSTLEKPGTSGWSWVHERIPTDPAPEGLVCVMSGPSRVVRRFGIWIMPDNRSHGALEEFLLPLVPEGDVLWRHSQKATEEARSSAGAQFPVSKLNKAVLRAWLAWQRKPGQTFEHALKDGFFGDLQPGRCAVLDHFLTWFETLYGDAPPAPPPAA